MWHVIPLLIYIELILYCPLRYSGMYFYLVACSSCSLASAIAASPRRAAPPATGRGGGCFRRSRFCPRRAASCLKLHMERTIHERSTALATRLSLSVTDVYTIAHRQHALRRPPHGFKHHPSSACSVKMQMRRVRRGLRGSCGQSNEQGNILPVYELAAHSASV
jgi:hypothetical protein